MPSSKHQNQIDPVLKRFSSCTSDERISLFLQKGIELSKKSPVNVPQECEIHNCQSRTWVDAEFVNNELHIQAGSDSLIICGILSLLIDLLSGLSPEEISSFDVKELSALMDMEIHFVPSRSNIILHVLNKILSLAHSHLSCTDSPARPLNE